MIDFKMPGFTTYLNSIKGLQDTPEQADNIQQLIDDIGSSANGNVSVDTKKEWQMQMD